MTQYLDSINDPSPSLSPTDKEPEQIHPEIDQNKSQSHKQQTGHRIFTCGSDATPVFDSVTGLNPEALLVMLMQLSERDP
jgi:hypothetical protein